MSDVSDAISFFESGFNCAESILSVYAPQFGIPPEIAIRIGSSLGAGMGMAEICGAVTASCIILGLRFGRTNAEDKKTKERTYKLARKFRDKFTARTGSIHCKELLGCDISAPDGLKYAREQHLAETRCIQYVRAAAEILEEMISRDNS